MKRAKSKKIDEPFKVLVANDEEMQLEILKLMLESASMKVTAVKNGYKAFTAV